MYSIHVINYKTSSPSDDEEGHELIHKNSDSGLQTQTQTTELLCATKPFSCSSCSKRAALLAALDNYSTSLKGNLWSTKEEIFSVLFVLCTYTNTHVHISYTIHNTTNGITLFH